MANQNKFYDEADKNHRKAIAELLCNGVPTIEKKKGKKDQEKKPSFVVIQGPKPGKPTDLSRMRQVLLKLKHDAPNHLKPAPSKDAKTSDVATPSQAAGCCNPYQGCDNCLSISLWPSSLSFRSRNIHRCITLLFSTLISLVYISKLTTCAVLQFANSITLLCYHSVSIRQESS